MVHPRFSLRLLAVALAAVPALAQGRPAAPVGLGDVHGVVAGPAGPVGIGADYKAHFTAGGVAFTPALGDAAPHNLPLQWSLLDIRRGGDVVHEAATSVVPEAVGGAVQFARGAVTERYDVLANGLEQSFVFEAPLGTSGDLVVRGRINCELPAVAGDDGTWSWLQPGVGGVHIGAVTGIDAAGRRVQGSQRLHGDVLELVLPAAFVDGASYPLTLDPLLGTTVLFEGPDAIECDVAARNGGFFTNCFVVWARRYSTVDFDVYGRFGGTTTFGSLGIGSGGLVAFDATAAMARRPRVGDVGLNFLVVWEQSSTLFAPRQVMACATNLDVFTGTVAKSADLIIAGPTGDPRECDVGTGRVLFRDDTGIYLQDVDVLTPFAVGLVGAPVTIAAGPDFRGHSISERSDANGMFLVAYGVAGSLSDDLVVKQLTTASVQVGPALTLGSSLLDDTYPAIDGRMLAWERTESTLGNARRDVICATLSLTANGPLLIAGPTVLAGASGVDEFAPTVAVAGLRHAIAYVRTVNLLDTDVEAWLVNDDCTTCNSQMVLQGLAGISAAREGAPRLSGIQVATSVYAYLAPLILVYTEAVTTPPFLSQVVAQAILPIANAPAPVNIGGQCGQGGTIGTTSVASVGNSVFAVELTNGDPTALHLLSLGMPTLGIACGPCVLTNPISLGFAGGGGTATSTFPIPCTPSLVNLQFEAQWLSLIAGVSPCPLVADLSASNRLLITVGN